MKLVVIDREDSWHVADLKRAAGDQHWVASCTYNELSVVIDNESRSQFCFGDQHAAELDCILTRAMPSSSLEQIVFRMDWLARLQQQYNVIAINPAKTIEASVDKYLSLELIRANGVPVPRTLVSQTVDVALQHFQVLGGCSVVKPIFGSGGRRIHRLNEILQAEEFFATLVADQQIIYQQQYVEHGDSDLRLLTIGNQVLGMRRCRPGSWITNVGQGADFMPHEPSPLETDLALRSAEAVGAYIGGVDLVYDENGSPFVVEINACPSWKAISQVAPVDIAQEILKFVDQQIEASASRPPSANVNPH